MKHLIKYRYYRPMHEQCDHEHRTISGARRCAGRNAVVQEVWKRKDGRITFVCLAAAKEG